MKPPTLRPYQRIALAHIVAELATKRSTLLVLPTGCGKTIVFCQVIKQYLDRGKRALILAHRGELLDQAGHQLAAIGITNTGREQAEQRAADEPVVLASVHTLCGNRLDRFATDAFGLIVIDEAHHAPAKRYRAILDHFAAAKVLGVTATPDRLDGKGLGHIFDSVAYRYTLREAIDQGYLVPITSQRVRVEGIDLADISAQAGDFDQADLAKILLTEKNLHEVAAPLIELAGTRKTVVFTVNVAHAEALAEVLNRYRPDCAQWLSGELSATERRTALAQYRVGTYQFLANCALLTEGWDEPAVACIAVARPTKSRALYTQMIGRGTRLHPGKHDLLVLDFVGNSGKHRLITTSDILAGKPADDDLDIQPNPESRREPESTLLTPESHRVRVRAIAHFIAEEIDPFLPGVQGRRISRQPWAKNPATDKQLSFLADQGIKPPHGLRAGQASNIITAIFDREKRGLCTVKQARVLRRYGHPNPATLSKNTASQIIGRIFAGQGRSRRSTR